MFVKLRMVAIPFLLWLGMRIPAWSQAPGLRYLAEVGHLGTEQDRRTHRNLGPVRVTMDRSDLWLDGDDRQGKKWRVLLEPTGGIGWTNVWSADFDGDGREDLLVDAHFPGNGRCINPVTLTFLMMDSTGRPVPWTIHSNLPDTKVRFPSVPGLIRWPADHRNAELIVTDCEYSDPPRFGEDWHVAGVYRAEAAHWALVRPPDLRPYEQMTRKAHAYSGVRVLKSSPTAWLDEGNLPNPAVEPLRILEVLREDKRSGKRIRLSDGAICDGWPTVVIDAPGGREIMTAGSSDVESEIRRIVDQGLPVVLTGQTTAGKCSPTLLWATQR